MTTTTKYDTQASEFLAKFNMAVRIHETPFQDCPRWDMTDCKRGYHHHGKRYNVRIERTSTSFPQHVPLPSIEFDFWGSQHDAERLKRPTQYSILACVGSDVNMPTDADEVVAELGDMKPSQAQATADQARKLQAFFTEAEREALAEIQ